MERPTGHAAPPARQAGIRSRLPEAPRPPENSRPLRLWQRLSIGLCGSLALSAGALLITACPGVSFTADRLDSDAGDGGNFACTDFPVDNPGVVNDNCGVFVAPQGEDTNGAGTKEKPFRTLGAAMKAAQQQSKARVYACSGAYEGLVTIPGGISLFGGLDCEAGAWVPSTEKSTLAGPPDKIPMRLQAGGPILVDSFAVNAVDAVAMGESSIAVLVEPDASVELRGCDLSAGNGAPGMPGEGGLPAAPDAPMLTDSNKGDPTVCMSMMTMNQGGELHENAKCDGDEAPIGGAGGDASEDVGAEGENGHPSGMMGKGGTGGVLCAQGGDGGAGADGEPGTAGTSAQGIGVLSSTKGWVGASGGSGGKGNPGQGGGGGAGQKGKAGCLGASGGSGGAGGCGGLGGGGGQPGGSSIALVSLNASMTLTNVMLTAANGGKGGNGGDAQTGGIGAPGADGGATTVIGLEKGCQGGNGGEGGEGGHGGGGAGGHSLGIAYLGALPTTAGMFSVVLGMEGDGGSGGKGNAQKNAGAPGVAQESLPFN